MDVFKLKTYSEDETKEIAEQLAPLLDRGDVLTLEGDLGAGKTTFTKGLAKGLGISRMVNSPTFTIIKEYEGNIPLYHMDVYRLEDSNGDLGFDEYFYGDGVTVVEWAHFIQELLPDEYLKITIKYVTENEREFTFAPIGERYVHVCEEFVHR